ncbi:hypothetical protein AQUCO_06400007v1 [Aquilegia coerulea]|uniref:Uncharacterized protein n=1 Tax=Aquilegia coerulea TaxID=218851 RepID=A0A2G5CDM8_AQUCA|nr:hypothetical protein AQUCO_06400007v1 [Aquilegia coerulea]
MRSSLSPLPLWWHAPSFFFFPPPLLLYICTSYLLRFYLFLFYFGFVSTCCSFEIYSRFFVYFFNFIIRKPCSQFGLFMFMCGFHK